MTRDDQYRQCAREGLSQAQTARRMGVSSAAVCYARRRLGLKFGPSRSAPIMAGRQLFMVYNRYPWADMAVDDWFVSSGCPYANAGRASKVFVPKRFKGTTQGGVSIVVRVA